MAAVSYHTHHATPRKPDAARVLQSYWHIVETQGRRGALRKTGDIYGISDETVRRYLAAHDAAHNAPETPVDELAYISPPGGYSPPIAPFMVADSAIADAETATATPHDDTNDSGELMSSDNATDAAQPQEMELDADELPHATLTQCHADELEPVVLDAPPMPQPPVTPGHAPTFRLVDALTFCYEHAPLVQLAVCVVLVAFLVAFVGA